MKKIAIVTLYGDENIGNKLQNFAVQELLEKRGFETTTLRVELDRKDLKFNSKKIKIFLINILSFIPIKWKKGRKHVMYKKREKRFQSFSKKFLNVGEKINIYLIPKNLQNQYNYFVVGSDQVWHNWSGTKEEIEFFFLRFVERQKRVCISPSFGRDNISDKERYEYKKGLNGFRMLSCREDDGIVLIKSVSGRKAKLLIDPTMMLSENEWIRISRRPKYSIGEKYLLVYMLGNESESYRKITANMAKENKLQIIDIFNFKDSKYFMTDPSEFLYLVKNAELICTDSFHGCVFSILFHRNFICFSRQGSNAENMESRLKTLLQKFGLEERFFDKLIPEKLFSTSFKYADKQLKMEKEFFSQYLDECFDEN